VKTETERVPLSLHPYGNRCLGFPEYSLSTGSENHRYRPNRPLNCPTML